MVEEQRRRIESEMTRLIEDIDRNYLRKMQVLKSFLWLEKPSFYLLERLIK